DHVVALHRAMNSTGQKPSSGNVRTATRTPSQKRRYRRESHLAREFLVKTSKENCGTLRALQPLRCGLFEEFKEFRGRCAGVGIAAWRKAAPGDTVGEPSLKNSE